MHIHLDQLTPTERYFAMTQCIIPRPIAWVLSENASGNYNLAPYSFFTGICSDPPLLIISAGKKTLESELGQPKDTRANIAERKHFVVHIADAGELDLVNGSSASLAREQSEIDELNLELADMPGFALPRLAQSKVAMACELYRLDEIGVQQQAVIYGEIKQIYLDDEVAEYQGKRLKINPEKINPLARLGGAWYSQLGELLTVTRPK